MTYNDIRATKATMGLLAATIFSMFCFAWAGIFDMENLISLLSFWAATSAVYLIAWVSLFAYKNSKRIGE